MSSPAGGPGCQAGRWWDDEAAEAEENLLMDDVTFSYRKRLEGYKTVTKPTTPDNSFFMRVVRAQHK